MKHASTRIRIGVPLATALTASVALVAGTSLTDAAWTDDEYTSATAGVMVAGDCSTTNLFSAEGSGRQLSGSLAGENLDEMAAISGITVEDDAGTVTIDPENARQMNPHTYTAPLNSTVLSGPLLSAAVGLNAPAGEAGGYTQWAQARSSGQAAGAAGLVSDQSGAIDAGGTADGSATVPQSASINISSLIPAAAADMTLDLGALASSAQLDACRLENGWPALNPVPSVTRDYGIAGAELNVAVPAGATMTAATMGEVNAVAEALTSLTATEGALVSAVNNGITALLDGLLQTLGIGSISTDIRLGTVDLSAVTPLLDETLSDGVVTVDLADAAVTVDFAALTGTGGGLNDLAPNTSVLLNPAMAADLNDRLATLLSDWAERVVAALENTLAATPFTLHTSVVLSAEVLEILPDVAEVNIDYSTSLGAFLSDGPPVPAVSVSLLGVELPGLDAILDPLIGGLLAGTGNVVAQALQATVFGPDALLADASSEIEALTVPVVSALGSALQPLTGVLSLMVNVQPDQPGAPDSAALAGEDSPGQYKISALRVAAVGTAAEIYLATSSAGPVAFRPAGSDGNAPAVTPSILGPKARSPLKGRHSLH